ncbi:MAG: hypothetical protein BGO59_33050 [Spirosoma sp. 48-14]|nr:MAG: hypothetical protein BGO59_33050 [Spirosoma sp. 48-14]
MNRGDAMYMSLRSMIIRTTGLNPKETSHMRVFFRQNLSGMNYKEIYDELCTFSTGRYSVMEHLDILISPTLGIKETQWYSIIRYCLYCWKETAIASVVFAPPTSSGMNLHLLHDVPFLLKRFDNEMRWGINQMIALRIAIWLTKPTYLTRQTDEQPLDTFTNCLNYARRALFDALDVHQASSESHLKDILHEEYKLDLQMIKSRNRKILLRLDNGLFTWTDVCDSILNHTTIAMWLKFNIMLKKDPIVDRIRRGVVSNAIGTVTL